MAESSNRRKAELITHCREIIQARIDALEEEIKYLVEDIAEDTKSSAGDKYETSREMANIERQKLTDQLAINKKSLGFPLNLSAQECHEVQPGALVDTDKGKIFIAVSLGQVQIMDDRFFVISANAPLAQALLGAKTGDLVNFNNQQYKLLAVT